MPRGSWHHSRSHLREGWTGAVRPSRRPLRGLLRMRNFLNALTNYPYPEERPKGASRRTLIVDAALVHRGSPAKPRWISATRASAAADSGPLAIAPAAYSR